MPRQNTHHSEHPSAVLREIERLGLNITIARKRRGETQGQWASKLGVSQPTMARIERGDPSVAMASYVMCMWLINQARGLADLVAPLQDHAALEREVLRLRRQGKRPLTPKPASRAVAAPKPARKAATSQASAARQRGTAKPVTKEKNLSTAAAGKVPAKKAPANTVADSTHDIHKRIRASAAKGNATAQGLAALLLQPRRKAP